MNMSHSSRYLEYLIGLQCRVGGAPDRYLIIDISPTHSLVLLGADGKLSYGSPSEIYLTDTSRDMLYERITDQSRRESK